MTDDGDRADLWRKVRALSEAAAEAQREQARLWDAIAELRDELHDQAQRVTDVHERALRALTDALTRRDPRGNTQRDTFA